MNDKVRLLLWCLGAFIAVFIGLPVVVYLCSRMCTLGRLQALEFWRKNRREQRKQETVED